MEFLSSVSVERKLRQREKCEEECIVFWFFIFLVYQMWTLTWLNGEGNLGMNSHLNPEYSKCKLFLGSLYLT